MLSAVLLQISREAPKRSISLKINLEKLWIYQVNDQTNRDLLRDGPTVILMPPLKSWVSP